MGSQWKDKTTEDDELTAAHRPKRHDAVGDETTDRHSATSHSATLLDNTDYTTTTNNEDDDDDGDTPPCHDLTPRSTHPNMNENNNERRPNGTGICKTSTSKFTTAIWKVLPRLAVDLDNVGSVARDHLANERTWLAYVRTSLAIAGTGVALVQLFTISTSNEQSKNTLQRAARPLGATTVIIGAIVLCIGIFRYFHVQKSMIGGHFPVARIGVIIISTIMAALAAVIFGFLIGFKD